MKFHASFVDFQLNLCYNKMGYYILIKYLYLYLYLYLYFPFYYIINFPACQDCIQYTFSTRVCGCS